MLDPLPRWVRADVLTTGDLTISGRTVPGEGARAREVQRLLVSGADRDQLAAAGVGWVVTENGAGGSDFPRLALPVAYRDDDLTVYDVGGDTPGSAPRTLMLAAHAGVAGPAGLRPRRDAAVPVAPAAGSGHTHRRDDQIAGPHGGDEEIRSHFRSGGDMGLQ